MNYADIPSPFYRVTLKLLVFDDQHKLLVTQEEKGRWELPGGGWEHDESLEACLQREIQEELGVSVDRIDVNRQFMYRAANWRGYQALKIAMFGALQNYNFTPGDDMLTAKFITKSELLELDMEPDEAGIKKYADQIWR